ncbi:MAG: phage gp6-like head-tail connector protein [Actinobacteria bacterium]|nr:phage gp6-like head-tail connector protein [Actinomycetota bacterium]
MAANPLDVPKQAVHAINMLIGHWYFNREAVLTGTISKEIELAVAALLSPLRWRQYA